MVGCGKGAQCINQGGVYACKCPAGTRGNPEQSCTAGMSTVFHIVVRLLLLFLQQLGPRINYLGRVSTQKKDVGMQYMKMLKRFNCILCHRKNNNTDY